MCVIADVVDAYLEQSPLTGALKNARLKVRGKNLGQEGENLKLHG
jgi:hypothetical protein